MREGKIKNRNFLPPGQYEYIDNNLSILFYNNSD